MEYNYLTAEGPSFVLAFEKLTTELNMAVVKRWQPLGDHVVAVTGTHAPTFHLSQLVFRESYVEPERLALFVRKEVDS